MGAMQGIVDWLRKVWEVLHKPVPKWVKDFVTIVGQILVGLLKGTVKAYIDSIEAKIIEMSNTNFSNEEKFNAVWEFAYTLLPSFKESELDLIIQSLYNKLHIAGRV